MAKMKYVGYSDIREFRKNDLGEDSKKLSFNRYEVKDVDDSLVDALLAVGDFEQVADEEPKTEGAAQPGVDDKSETVTEPVSKSTTRGR